MKTSASGFSGTNVDGSPADGSDARFAPNSFPISSITDETDVAGSVVFASATAVLAGIVSARTGSGRGIIATGAGFSLATGSALIAGRNLGFSGAPITWRKTGSGLTPVAASIPVATTDTLILPSRDSSKVEPKMILASASTSSRIRLAASSTSNSVMSCPAVIFISTPLAPLMDISSRSGLAIACSAASVARLSPSASPVPIMALPISLITDLMSAKSRLIRPGMTIRSVTPLTPE